MSIEGCEVSGRNKYGIYLEDSGKYTIFDNVVTSCDICNEKIATKFFERKDKEFPKILERSHYPKDVWKKVHILGACDECLRKTK